MRSPILAVLLGSLVAAVGCASPADCLLGCVDIEQGEAIRLGTALVMTGEIGDVGEQGARAVELAVSERGELAGFPLEVVKEDSACTGAGGVSAMDVLSARANLVGIIGPSCSSAAEAILEEGALSRWLISPSNTSPLLTRPELHQPGYFRVAPSDVEQADRMAGYATDNLGIGSAVVITDGSDFMTLVGEAFDLALAEQGGTSLDPLALGEDLDALEPLFEGEVELAYLALSPWQAGDVATWIRARPELDSVVLAGLDQLDHPAYLQLEAAEGTLLTRFALEHAGAGYESFVAAWEARYDDSPTAEFHAHAWDATQLLFAGLEDVAEPLPGGAIRFDLEALREALHAVTGLPALTGLLGCDDRGECAAPTPVDVRVVQDGATVPAPGP